MIMINEIFTPFNTAILVLVFDTILSIFQYKKTGKLTKNTPLDIDEVKKRDLDDLIAYHEKSANALKRIRDSVSVAPSNGVDNGNV